MMGDFSGNAGLLSLWFDEEAWDWKFEFTNCRMGKQHLWWVVHILNLITIGVGMALGLLTLAGKFTTRTKPKQNVNGKAVKANEDRTIDTTLAEFLQSSGKLDVPGAGKKSLRKKRSKRALNGSANCSPVFGN